jgi:shikimate kinase
MSVMQHKLEKSIVLIGLMGAGKSCIGRRLARRLDLPFLDSDEEIVKETGRPITELFDRFGEAAFRAVERRIMARLLDGPPVVLASGGGAFLDPETREQIRRQAISVWLKADLDLLVRRTTGRDHRPLLKNGEPAVILARLMAEREPVYAEADVIVQSTDEPADITMDRVLTALAGHDRPFCADAGTPP